MFLNIIQIPITLKCLGNEVYGVWLTILSVTSWVSIMDIGIGNGMRNKLAEALAVGDKKTSNAYISTAYVVISIISFFVFIILIPLVFFSPWQSFFNINSISNSDLQATVFWSVLATLMVFILGLVNQILNAVQQNGLTAFISIAANGHFLIVMYVLNKTGSLDLKAVSILYLVTNTASYLLFSVFFFKKQPDLKPTFKNFDRSKVRSIVTLGFSFFIIQIAVIVIFSTDSFLIAQLLGPKEVTSYSITMRVFNVVSMFVTMSIAPLWSAFTEAYAKKEYGWIRKKIRTFNLIMIPLSVGAIVCAIFFKNLIQLWLGKDIDIPTYLPFGMALFIIISTWNSIYAFFLNGISRVKEQLVTAIIAMAINIPLCFYFAKNLNLGSLGIILATVASLSIFALVGPLVTYSILNKHE